jgi:hypothetical protein
MKNLGTRDEMDYGDNIKLKNSISHISSKLLTARNKVIVFFIRLSMKQANLCLLC